MTSNEMGPELRKTSHSEVESFLLCERRHYYSYGLEIQSLKQSEALLRGIIGHEALANYYRAIKAGESKEDAARTAYRTVTDVADGYDAYDMDKVVVNLLMLLKQYFKTYADDDFEVIDVEKEYKVPVGDDFYIIMYVDLILRIPGQGIVFWDHKFSYNFFNPDSIDLLPQLPKYLGVARMAGEAINGVGYNELRYFETKENKADSSKKFKRTQVQLTTERVVRTMREQVMAARQIRTFKDGSIEDWEQNVLRVANDKVCSMCPFKQICAVDLNGQDNTLVLEYNYKKKERRIESNG